MELKNRTFFKRCAFCVLLFVFCAGVKVYPDEKLGIVKASIKYIVSENTDIKKETEKLVSFFKKDESLETLSPVSNLISPVKSAEISKGFGIQDAANGEFNYGVYIKTKSNENVVSAGDGKVVDVLKDEKKGTSILVSHSCDITTLYACLGELIINVGDRVERGQAIAKPDGSGAVYFELKRNDTYLDPTQFIEFKEQK